MSSAQSTTQAQTYPLYGTTYTLHRISPLYNGSTPILASLAIHARRFRDIVKGDVLRGIQIAHESALSSAAATTGDASRRNKQSRDRGGFRGCSWELLGDEAAWERAHGDRATTAAGGEDEDDEMLSNMAHVSVNNARGVRIEVSYERASYSALLLGPTSTVPATVGATAASMQKSIIVKDGFTHLPLLCTKMPAALREALVGYLATAFDARVAQMKLSSDLMASVLESVLSTTIEPFERDLRPVSTLSRGVGIQLQVPCTMPELRNVDVQIEQGDVLEFVKYGRRLLESAATGRSRSTAKSAAVGERGNKCTGPFMKALEAYMSQHMSLDLAHPAVTIHRISLGAYAFSSDGKMKIATQQQHGESAEIINMIIRAAGATGRLQDATTVVRRNKADEAGWYNGVQWDGEGDVPMSGNPRVGGRGIGRGAAAGAAGGKERVPSDPPPPYEVHDPALRDELMDDV